MKTDHGGDDYIHGISMKLAGFLEQRAHVIGCMDEYHIIESKFQVAHDSSWYCQKEASEKSTGTRYCIWLPVYPSNPCQPLAYRYMVLL